MPNKNFRKEIFGKTVEFIGPESRIGLIAEAVDLYADSNDSEWDLMVNISESGQTKFVSKNPSIHSETSDGFCIDFGEVFVEWILKGNGKVIVNLNVAWPLTGRRFLARYRDMECATELEKLVQILYELVLVPSVYFFDDIAPIHASCIESNGKAVLFTGTGGVGKSSALLRLSEENRFGFVADDIVIVHENGKVYPNFSWPKIYGYNCVDNRVKHKILDHRGWADKLQFALLNQRNPARVRRKIRPDKLFVQTAAVELDPHTVFCLFRENTENLKITAIGKNALSRMIVDCVMSEYWVYNNHIRWHSYNRLALDLQPLVSLSEVESRWQSIIDKFLVGCNTEKISIPFDVDHGSYVNFIAYTAESL